MIVWLASYPRCGNTLLRTILKNVFNISSYDYDLKDANEEIEKVCQTFDKVWNYYGHLKNGKNWEEFYKEIKEDKSVYYLKTHHIPIDDSPAIYIIRDGRKAIFSYFNYMKEFFPKENRTLIDLILGNDYYVSWSEHYHIWNPKFRKNTLLIKYEDMIINPNEIINKIEQFLAIRKINEWNNPFKELQIEKKDFFREGKISWEKPKEWKDFHNELFMSKHYNLMSDLCYLDSYDVKEKVLLNSNELIEIKNAFEKIIEQRNMFEKAASARLKLLQNL